MSLPEEPDSGESWRDFLTRTMPARKARRDQIAAALQEKIDRLSPELDPDREKARHRLILVLTAGAVEAAPTMELALQGLAQVLANYVIKDLDRDGRS